MEKRIPIPPLSVVELKKLWPHARKQGREKGNRMRIGYYYPQDGLDCVWLVDDEGNYDWTTDHEWLYDKFKVIEYSDETDFYGENRPPLINLTLKAEPGGVSHEMNAL